MDITRQKKALRKEIAEKRKSVFGNVAYVSACSAALWAKLEAMEEFRLQCRALG